jgi:hypothetical protein
LASKAVVSPDPPKMAGGLKNEGKPLEVCSGGFAGCWAATGAVADGGRGADGAP